MPTIFVDRRQYEVRDGVNLLDACLSLGLDLPYFCWHPAMGSAGACRQCAVTQYRNEEDTRGRIVMACMTPAADGARIAIESDQAREFRAGVAEWLMVHHPHDCPVCDEGGECHLQDMTVMNGHAYRRYRGLKRTFRNQDLGPFIRQEMNRCIQCYRCVRYYRDYAGGRDFDAHFLRDRVFFGRHEDGVLESEFSGNLVEACPTGVFTDKTLARHYTRKWDERSAPSVCVHCAVGCNTIPGERYGMLRRIRPRFNGAVNGYFLCDRGRYGYEFVNSDLRLRVPFAGRGPERVAAGAADAVARAASLLSGARVIGIGSPRASLEANFALRTLVGPERFSPGIAAREHRLVTLALDILRRGPAPPASLHDVDRSDAALVLGEDVTGSAPMLALALRQSVRRQPMAIAAGQKIPEWDDIAVRQAVQDAKGPLFIASVAATRLDDVATETFRAAPDDLARLGFAVAHAIDANAPDPGGDGASDDLVGRIARALGEASQPVIVAGTGLGSEATLQAAANVARALARTGRPVRLALTVPECNTLGAALLGGQDLEAAFETVERGEADTLVVLENDLYRRGSETAVRGVLDRVQHVIVIDHVLTATGRHAEIGLPAGTFAESDGTLVNNEGRAQRFFQVLAPAGDVQESWRWVRDLAAAAGRADVSAWQTLDDIIGGLASGVPALAGAREAAPPADLRVVGLKIAREPHRYSGRTAILADRTVHEPKPPGDPDTALGFTMEGFQGQPPPALVTRFWAPGWNSVQSVNSYQQEVGGPLRGGDPGRRLIEPAGSAPPYFDRIPPPVSRDASTWLCVPLHHIFGSEELSAVAGALAGRVPQPYIALAPADLGRAGVGDGDEVLLSLDGAALRLVVRTWPSLPSGLAGVPVGLPGQPWLPLPAPGRIGRIEARA